MRSPSCCVRVGIPDLSMPNAQGSMLNAAAAAVRCNKGQSGGGRGHFVATYLSVAGSVATAALNGLSVPPNNGDDRRQPEIESPHLAAAGVPPFVNVELHRRADVGVIRVKEVEIDPASAQRVQKLTARDS